ncbi:MAG: hypothetical protein ACOX63_00215 [Christensenellales bacterium]|jgi:hypothetical protein
MSRLKAGWGQADITPRGGPVSLCGQFETRITSEILDPMMAVALILEKDGVRSIWVGCDIIAAYDVLTDEVETLLLEQLPGFEPNQLAIAGTHIHTGPYIKRDGLLSLTGDKGQKEDAGTLTTKACRHQIAEGICRAIMLAHHSLEESVLGLSVANIITGVNRRVVYRDGSAKMYGQLNTDQFSHMESRDGGPSQFIYVHRLSDGALTGVVCNVPCTAQCDEMANYISADYWGVVREHVGSALGKDVHILPLCRAAGDLSPHPMVDQLAGFDHNRWGRQLALDLGNWIAENIISHQKRILRRYDADTVLKQYGTKLTLPLWTVTAQEYRDACEYLTNPDNYEADKKPKDLFGFANAWTRKKRMEEHPTHVDVSIRATRIGDMVLLSLPFETYIEYADRIRAALPEVVVFDVQLACDCLGYLPTKRAVQGGHYSANIFNGLCSPDEGGEIMVKESVRMIRGLF